MKKILLAALCLAPLIGSFTAAVEPRAPTDAEIRAKQALGRTLISPNGQFFVYEWLRPYNWLRKTGSLPANAANRMQSWLYRVDINGMSASSDYLFFPGAVDSYWLGAFAPDGSKVSFYALDNDNNVLKAGVAALTDANTPKLTWFSPAPDGVQLDQPPIWLSSEELVYPTAGGGKVIGNAATGETKPCSDCEKLIAQAKAASNATAKGKPKYAGKPAPNTRILAHAADGELTVYEKSDAKVLSLAFKKSADAAETVVFENERRLIWSPPKLPPRPDRDKSEPEKKGSDSPPVTASP